MRVHICGARGSTPAPGAEFLRYGGHTSCVAVTADGDEAPTLILDAGTGIRSVTGLLAGQPYAGHILLSHLHWDHVHGLPFFRAGDTPGARVTLLLPAQPGGQAAETVLADGMSPPHFPITPGELRGEWTFGTVPAEAFKTGPFEFEAYEIPHKGGTTVGYRVSDGRSAVAYLPDHCPTLAGPGPDGWGEYLARHAGSAVAVLFHHKPDRTDAALDALGARLAGPGAPVVVAAERDILQT